MTKYKTKIWAHQSLFDRIRHQTTTNNLKNNEITAEDGTIVKDQEINEEEKTRPTVLTATWSATVVVFGERPPSEPGGGARGTGGAATFSVAHGADARNHLALFFFFFLLGRRGRQTVR